eukprot:757258-Lingulodinium_polyedra.AAC.1
MSNAFQKPIGIPTTSKEFFCLQYEWQLRDLHTPNCTPRAMDWDDPSALRTARQCKDGAT